MVEKKKIRKINRKLRQKALNDRDIKLFHSSSYHNFFEGYTEYPYLDKKGKRKFKRVYTGNWRRQNLDNIRYVLLRLVYITLFAGIIFLLAFTAFSQGGSGSVLYMVIPELATVSVLFWIFYVIFINYIFLPRKMTMYDFRTSSDSLKKSSITLSICFGLDAIMSILYLLTNKNASGDETKVVFALIGAGILSILIFIIESRVPYIEIENEIKETENGIHIN